MAKPKKGVVPPQLRPYLFKKGGGRVGSKSKKGKKTYRARAKSTRTKKQGIVSWLTSGIAVVVSLSNIFVRLKETFNTSIVAKPNRWAYFADVMVADHTGFCPGFLEDQIGHGPYWWAKGSFDAKRLVRGYAPFVAGFAVKKVSSLVVRTAPIKTLIPRIG